MRLKSLQLKNFRCFENVLINFEPNYTVLIGVNGAGKSSKLDAISIAMGSFLAGMDGIRSNAIHTDDVRYRMFEEGTIPNREPQYPASVIATAETARDNALTWQRNLNSETGRTTIKESKVIIDYAKDIQNKVRRGERDVILPLLAYYGTGRLWARKQNRLMRRQGNSNALGSRLRGYRDCLDINTNEKMMLQWFSKMTYVRLQDGQQIPELEAVEQAVADCYLGLDNRAQTVQFRFSVKKDELELKIHYYDGSIEYLPVRLLSDGIKTVINMVADIAYRMAILNPHLLGEVVKKTDGIVMIDEVDMHLHPSWQKRIIQDLTRIFPNIQFIVTTHAPSVLVNVYKENIRLIKNNTVEVPQNYSYGRNITAVIHELMETEIRPQDILNKLKEFNNVLDEGNISQAKEILTEIEKQLGSNDQDVVDAKIAIALESV